MITVLEQRPDRLPMTTACEALGLNRSSVYAWRRRKTQDGIFLIPVSTSPHTEPV